MAHPFLQKIRDTTFARAQGPQRQRLTAPPQQTYTGVQAPSPGYGTPAASSRTRGREI